MRGRVKAAAFAAFFQASLLLAASGTFTATDPDTNPGGSGASPPVATPVSALLPSQATAGVLPDTRWRHVRPADAPPAEAFAAAAETASAPAVSAVTPSTPAVSAATPSGPVPSAATQDAPAGAADTAALVLASAQLPSSPDSLAGPPAPSAPPADGSTTPPAVSSTTPPAASSTTPPASTLPPPGTLPGDYDLTMPWGEPSFEAYRAGYLSEGGKKWLTAMVERGRPWMSFIMQKIYAYGLPSELAWLPIIESEYTANAVSRSGAVGMWQFMRNSVGGYGIRIDDWVDERRDFMKATDAALRKLADNYATLGDWNLAIAAYNMGLGAISRAMALGGTRDFFALRDAGRLSRETSAYVPKFLAVASILDHPARFGMPIAWDPPVEWETVEPKRSVDLGLLALASGIPVQKLRIANAELKYAVTPPWKGYLLKVPDGTAAPIVAALDDPAKKLLRYTLHTVRSGDSISAISRGYGTPVQLIVDANPGLQPSRIMVGQVLVIPVLKDGTPQPPPVPVDDAPPFTGSYSVTKGDSLWSLALRFGVRPETLAERNGLELTSVLREGMNLSVPITKP